MRLDLVAAVLRPDLLADPVRAALSDMDSAQVEVAQIPGGQIPGGQIPGGQIPGGQIQVAQIDPDLADTAAFCSAYDVPLSESANCVIMLGRRAGVARFAACVVLATTRVDVNGVARRQLDVRKASFAPMELAVVETGMEYGGITPVGLPPGWPLFVDPAVAGSPQVVVGSGLRRSKLVLSGAVLAGLPGAVVVDRLGS